LFVRAARPLLTFAFLVTMVLPLFHTRIPGRVQIEYLDGWNVRTASPAITTPTTAGSRPCGGASIAPAGGAAVHLRGDSSPVRNVTGQPPLVDPVTCALLVLGIAGAAANLWRPVYGSRCSGSS